MSDLASHILYLLYSSGGAITTKSHLLFLPVDLVFWDIQGATSDWQYSTVIKIKSLPIKI